MYQDLRENLWWVNMKGIEEFVSPCLVCQQIKAKHQKLTGSLQPLHIPKWKWEHIMDFVTDLPKTLSGNDVVWVIMDRLTKSAHFLGMKTTFPLKSTRQVVHS